MGEVLPALDLEALEALITDAPYANDTIVTEVRRLAAERDALRKKLTSADKGLDRWCAWQDGLKAVHDEMDIRDEVGRRLIAAGFGTGPACRHIAERDQARAQVAQLRAGLTEAIEAAEKFGASGAVSVLWRLVHRHDPEHEHFGDNGECFECGAATDPTRAGR